MSETMRVSDAEREAASAALQRCYEQGRLSTEELDARSGAVQSATTHGELAAALADLPVALMPPAVEKVVAPPVQPRVPVQASPPVAPMSLKAKLVAGAAALALVGGMAWAAPSLNMRDAAYEDHARANVTNAFKAAKAYYVENLSYQGFDSKMLTSYEPVLAPETGMQTTPGENANGTAIFITGQRDDTRVSPDNDPTAHKLSLCSVSEGDEVFCIHADEQAGTTSYGQGKTLKAALLDERPDGFE